MEVVYATLSVSLGMYIERPQLLLKKQLALHSIGSAFNCFCLVHVSPMELVPCFPSCMFLLKILDVACMYLFHIFIYCICSVSYSEMFFSASDLDRVVDLEVIGWSWTRIFLSDSRCPIGIFLHHTLNLGIRVEITCWTNFIWNFCWNRFLAVHHDFHWFQQPNFIPFMLRSQIQKFWKGWSQIFRVWLRNPGPWN